MKKLTMYLCLAGALFAAADLSAQKKGDLSLNGSAGFQSGASSGDDTFSYGKAFGNEALTTLGLGLDYFVADNLRLGIRTDYTLKIGDQACDFDGQLALGLSAAWYVKLADRFFYTPELSLGRTWIHISGDHDDARHSSRLKGFGAELSLAQFEFRPTRHFGMSVKILSLSGSLQRGTGVVERSDFYRVSLAGHGSVALRYYF